MSGKKLAYNNPIIVYESKLYLMKKLMISCKEATELIVRKDLEKLSFIDRVSLRFHTLMCRFCRAFEVQNDEINSQAATLDNLVTDPMPEESKKSVSEALNSDG